jgi:hypothetical protein
MEFNDTLSAIWWYKLFILSHAITKLISVCKKFLILILRMD